MDLLELYDIYVPIFTTRGEETARNYRWNFHKYMGLVRGVDIQKLVPSQIQAQLARMTGSSQTTIRSVYGDLVLVLRRAYADGLTDRDLSLTLMKPKGKRVEQRRALTPEEREIMIRVGMQDRKYYGMLLMMLCGCRPGEAYRVTTGDIDRERETLHIRGTKTAFSDRFVPCPRIILDLTENLPEGLISTSQTGLQVSKECQRRIWHSFWIDCHVVGGGQLYRGKPVAPYPVGEDLTAYCLRHEYCTNLARKGVDLRITQRLMGHSTPDMTLAVYTALSDKDILTDELSAIVNNL